MRPGRSRPTVCISLLREADILGSIATPCRIVESSRFFPDIPSNQLLAADPAEAVVSASESGSEITGKNVLQPPLKSPF